MVDENSELIVKFDSVHSQIYVVDQELYKEIKVEKMSSVGTFDIKAFLKSEIERANPNKKRDVKLASKEPNAY